ncbi:MAG: VWA domain-containing protein [Actinomycetota bacterium]|nr:VWA domain-containing protein [Actinomycetota bacterium]
MAPGFLAALLLLPFLAGAYLFARRRRRRYAVRYPATALVAAVAVQAPKWRRWLVPALLAGAGIASVLALARPQATVAVPVERASVMLITDASGSMEATDVAPTRLQAARAAGERFLDRVPESLMVGFVSYSTAPLTLVEPSLDRVPIRSALSALQAEGGTATGDALRAALDRLAARRGKDGRVAPAAVVLLSDGKTTSGSSPLTAARRAESLGIPVHTVALGTPNGVVFNGPFGSRIPVPPDPRSLRQIAELSGGRAFRVEDSDELDRVYESLGSRIGTREQRREVSSMFAGGGLVLLLAAVAAGLRWRPRLP